MNLKSLLPYENFTLTTALAFEEVHKRIYDNVEPKKPGLIIRPFRQSGKPYQGQLFVGSFTISRVIEYRNSFLPVITGKITSVAQSTQIKIHMRLEPIIMIFIVCWLSFVGFASIIMFITGLINSVHASRIELSPTILIPFGMFIFGCMLTIFGFKGESSSTRSFFVKLLEAQVMK